MNQHVHQLEGVVQDLFDEVCPPVHGGQRALKPFLAHALGSLLPDPNRRQLPDRRAYFRLDFGDFLDYATSDLAPTPNLSSFPDGEAQFYQALSIDSLQPHLTLPEFQSGLALLDAALARSRVFASVTMRFRSFASSPPPFLMVTITFAPSRAADTEHSPLDEWDRCWIGPPVPGDPQWRFAMSGVYTDYLLDEMERHPSSPSALTAAQIEGARADRSFTHDQCGGLFELARLGLLLPGYFDFMYDLVVTEAFPPSPPGPAAPMGRRSKPRTTSTNTGPVYRLVKSIRVIRPTAQRERTWTAPRYSFAVGGHWRNYRDSSTKGHDPAGHVVLGKTWVHDYVKGRGKAPSPGTTESETEDPRVVISIKQTLAYARDVLSGTAIASSTTGGAPPDPGSTSIPAPAPSEEWMVTERAKLTFQLRYLILRRDHYRCSICGRSAASEPSVRLEVDHKVPVSDWGRTEETNLWTLCRECNRGKGAKALHLN